MTRNQSILTLALGPARAPGERVRACGRARGPGEDSSVGFIAVNSSDVEGRRNAGRSAGRQAVVLPSAS